MITTVRDLKSRSLSAAVDIPTNPGSYDNDGRRPDKRFKKPKKGNDNGDSENDQPRVPLDPTRM